MIRTLIDEIKDHIVSKNGSRTISIFPKNTYQSFRNNWV